MIERNWTQIRRDNPNPNCLIEVGTKAWVRADVWGDAAGTAPAVTSVRASAFDRFFSPGPFKSTLKRISWFARFIHSLVSGVPEPCEAEPHYHQYIPLDGLRELAGID